MPKDTTLAVMDLFLLKGRDTLIYIGLAIMSTINSQIMDSNSIEQIQSKVLKGSKNPLLANYRQILRKSKKYTNIVPYEIKRFREHYLAETYKDINQAITRNLKYEQNSKKKKQVKSINDRKNTFLKEFPNMGIARRPGEKRIPLVSCSMKDPKAFFTCNPKWPVCSFDFTYRKVIIETFAYKARRFNVVQDHFYGQNDPTQAI